MQQFKAIISGGGTGGHIFPALAIAKALEKKVSNIEILFVGATGKMEMSKIPAEGYKIKGLWISGLQRRITIKKRRKIKQKACYFKASWYWTFC